MNVLVLCDDYWHPANTAKTGLVPLAEEGFHFDYVESAADWSAEKMAEYPVVLFAKANNVSAADRSEWMTDAVQDAFVDYVRAGGGLLVVHSGTVGYDDAPALRRLIGGVFLHHPKQCPVTVTPVMQHAVTEGVAPFTLTDEHYHMAFDAADEGDVDLFLIAESEHGMQPAGWARAEDDGRACTLTPGHNVEVWLNASYQRMLRNAMRWCSGG